MSKAQYFKS